MNLDRELSTLFGLFGREIDDATAALYTRALEDIPIALLTAAMARAVRTRRFLPRVAELREDAEACRQELSQRFPFHPCDLCADRRPGWIIVLDPDGVRREARCECWHAHQAHLAGYGYTGEPVYRPQLLAAGDE